MDFLNRYEIGMVRTLHRALSCKALDRLTKTVTLLGNGGVLYILAAVTLMLLKYTRLQGYILALGLSINLIVVNFLIKPLVGRRRPYDFWQELPLITPALPDSSFPSGHTAGAFALAAALLPAGSIAFAIALGYAALMGFSRVYLMMHYPTDVVGGAILGFSCGYLAVCLLRGLAV